MACSARDRAKRTFVKLLLRIAVKYKVHVEVSRDSPDALVMKAYRKVMRYAHPDKGGHIGDAQRLSSAKDQWEEMCRTVRGSGRPAAAPLRPPLKNHTKDFRFNSSAGMLTYQGISGIPQWQRFVDFVHASIVSWRVKYWCATMEANENIGMHIHLMLQFHRKVDRLMKGFAFEGVHPRCDGNDICGQGICKKRLQESIDRGMFYVFANKVGTQRTASGQLCIAGNYEPCWERTPKCFRYQVKGAWPETLWKQRKLASDTYERYLYASRDGVPSRKRNFELCRQREQAEILQLEIAAVTKRIRSNKDLFTKFPSVPAANEWLQLFSRDRARYPFLLVLGASHTGKTEWAKSLFHNPLEMKVGDLENFPDKMRSFDRVRHDAVILDDVRDLSFCIKHQEKLQGKYDYAVEFGSTPGGQCAYEQYLFRIPLVVTANYTTRSLGLLETDDYLSLSANRVVVQWPPPDFVRTD